jgi:tetratricopeptide (TPR) repeat protein
MAALATRAVESTFDTTQSFAAQTNNHRWLPQAMEAVRRAPRAGPAAWHTLWTHLQIGDLHVMRGSLGQALAAYRDGLALASDIAKADPGSGAGAGPANAGWQRDLSVSQEKIGDVLRAQGNLAEALDAYQASLAIAERLAKADPANAGWQRDVALSLQRTGGLAAQQGRRAEAMAAYRRGHDIMRRLTALAPDHAAFQRDLAWFQARIAELSAAEAPPPAGEPAKPAGWLGRLFGGRNDGA